MLVTGLLTIQTMFVATGSLGGTIHVPADFPTIQEAIDAADQLDVIVLEPGTYHENINFHAKIITVTGTNPSDVAIVAATVIDGSGGGSVVTFSGVEDGRAVLCGVTVTGGLAPQGGGIHCHGATPTIRQCRIVENSATSDGGGAYACHGIIESCLVSENGNSGLAFCDGIIRDSEITDNGCGICRSSGTVTRCLISRNGWGIEQAKGTISNCIISGNFGDGVTESGSNIQHCTITGNGRYAVAHNTGPIGNCILWDNRSGEIWGSSLPIYSCIRGGGGGLGSIQTNPLFLSPGHWDYANGGTWVEGDYHLGQPSPCIDAGDPNYPSDPNANTADIDGNPRVVGARVDIGAYEFQAACEGDDFDGDGTPDVCDRDIDDDGIPNVPDVCDYTPQGIPVDDQGRPRADLNLDCVVDLLDFAVFQISFFGP